VCGLIADAILLVSHHTAVLGECGSARELQLPHGHCADRLLVLGLHLHGPGHHVVGQDRLYDCHLSLCGAYNILLPGDYPKGSGRWGGPLVHPSMGDPLGSSRLAGGRHSDLLLAGIGLRRSDSLQLVQSSQ